MVIFLSESGFTEFKDSQNFFTLNHAHHINPKNHGADKIRSMPSIVCPMILGINMMGMISPKESLGPLGRSSFTFPRAIPGFN